jgi:hypothetical protein
MAFPRCLAGIILVTLASSAQAQFREQRSLVDCAPLKFPILERASSIQRASSLRPPSLNSDSSVQTDALSYPFTLVPTTPAKTVQFFRR